MNSERVGKQLGTALLFAVLSLLWFDFRGWAKVIDMPPPPPLPTPKPTPTPRHLKTVTSK